MVTILNNALLRTARGTESHTLNGRATQVFALDHEGKLKIVHERLSVARK